MDTSIKDLLEQDPFRPFTIVTTSGKKYEVRSSHKVALGKRQIFYCYPKSDKFAFIHVKEITAMETIETSKH